ncbi:alpha-(1,3)-fucosyltransferase 7-like [Antedon mediterranea]|uniref:alpha-(1,3)-fucosyltransferase 7-like n=1 Tax=Antedon mediterranea TaxID=105859 RepID=UPI003AF82922
MFYTMPTIRYSSKTNVLLNLNNNAGCITNVSLDGKSIDTGLSRKISSDSNPITQSVGFETTLVKQLSQPNVPRCMKTVLIWWIPEIARKHFAYGGNEGQVNCSDLECSVYITYSENVSKLANADIVIFHASFHTRNQEYKLFQKNRSPAQIWIWQTWESPTRLLGMVKAPPSWFHFNLTMSYSFESDIHVPYGRYIPFEHPQTNNVATGKNWLRGKTKLMAWIAHNCVSSTYNRFEFVKYLQTQLPIDIYGHCGNLTCTSWNQVCQALKNYKFFLALENSECNDYITEKFWEWPFLYDLNVVPIVYGPSRKDYEKVAPPNSFIHISDFDTLKDFVKYINLIENDVEMYNAFFDWKKMGRVVKENDNFSPSRICSLLDVKPPKQDHNINGEWWNKKCKPSSKNRYPFKPTKRHSGK